jgi:hypothetical protein
VPITVRQAGEVIYCTCGAQLHVPTLREITRLEGIELADPGERETPSWGVRQRLALVGLLCWAAAAGLGWFVYHYWPSDPLVINPKAIQEQIERMTPVDTLGLWSRLTQETNGREQVHEIQVRYERELGAHRFWLVADVLLVCLGGILISSTLWKKGWRREKKG